MSKLNIVESSSLFAHWLCPFLLACQQSLLDCEVSLVLLLSSIILCPHLHNVLRQCLCLPALSTCSQLMKFQCRLSRFLPASLTAAAPGVRRLPLDLLSASHCPDLSQFSLLLGCRLPLTPGRYFTAFAHVFALQPFVDIKTQNITLPDTITCFLSV